MRIHWEESATTKTAPFRHNPSGAGGFGQQALSLVGHDEKTSLRSSLRACNPKTPARGPRDFCYGLLVHQLKIQSAAGKGIALGRSVGQPGRTTGDSRHRPDGEAYWAYRHVQSAVKDPHQPPTPGA